MGDAGGAAASTPGRDPKTRGSVRGWRARVRRTPGGRHLLQLGAFLLGLFFILLGLVLAALPGPLTIPPILLGVWIWSTEFAWAEHLLDRAKRSGRHAWEEAKARPLVSALVTGSGIAAFAVGLYLVSRYELVEQARDAVGL